MADKEKKLTSHQKAFAHALMAPMSLSDAYRCAYSSQGKSESAIRVSASRLAKRPNVAAYIAELEAEARSKAVASRQEALEILSQIARGKVSDYLAEDGSIDTDKLRKAGSELQRYVRTQGKYGDREEITTRDPVVAIERLSRMLGWDKQADVGGVVFDIKFEADKASKGDER